MITLLLALGAMGQTQAVPNVVPPKDTDPVICKRSENPDVGTHMRPKPVCMKKSDWDLVEKNTQEELRKLGDRSSFDPGRGGVSR